MTWAFGHLSRGAYGVIVADPPWAFKHRSAKGIKKSAEAQYKTMALKDIAGLPVDELAGPDCFLFLWATAPALPQAIMVMTSWGFRYRSRMGWRKIHESGKPAMGPGHIVRTLHEDVLIGRRGKPRLARALPSLFEGVRREHSRKPDRFFDLVEAATPGVLRCELFSRAGHLGFTGWGDEAGKFDAVSRPLPPLELIADGADVLIAEKQGV